MNFASVTFLFYFLPIFIGLYFCFPGRRAKNLFLLIASLCFYAWGEGYYLAILIASVAANHMISQRIYQGNGRKTWLSIGITANLLLLICFKYGGFITEQLSVFGIPKLESHLPMGISFFTFQAMSLLVDIYRGQKPMKSITDTGVYITMFPQLMAGPIVRFNEIKDQILTRTESVDRFADGVRIFILGLAQKVLIADVLSGPVVIAFGGDPETLSASAAWIGVICFSFQIYYDFAGYSNMAIGLGRMLGFELPQNFNYPYSARSFQEFWRRWHMTLSRWFRDYVYIPLGGSRKGSSKTYRNLLMVFILCGFWHGAAWTFLLWGLWHGAFLIFERLLPQKLSSVLHGPVIGTIYTFLGVVFGWVLFRAESFERATAYWKAMLGMNAEGSVSLAQLGFLPLVQYTLIGACLLSWQGWEKTISRLPAERISLQMFKWVLLGLILLLCMLYVAGNTHQPFIYFRF